MSVGVRLFNHSFEAEALDLVQFRTVINHGTRLTPLTTFLP